MADTHVRAFLVDSMADAIWREGIEYLPMGASARLAAAAYDALPDDMRALLENPPQEADHA